MFVIFFDNGIMDIQEIRRKRLQLLIDKNYDGKQSAFIADTGANQGELSALLSGKRTFGERKARKIEKLAKVEERWLDRDEEINLEISTVNTHARISVIPIVGAAKLGDKENYFVDLEYPAGNGDGGILFSTQDENAYALRCIGDSMTPRIKPVNLLLSNRTDRICQVMRLSLRTKTVGSWSKLINILETGCLILNRLTKCTVHLEFLIAKLKKYTMLQELPNQH